MADVFKTCVDLSCGVNFQIPHHIDEQAKRNAERKVYCPNGHPLVYTTSKVENLHEQIASLERKLESMTASYRHADRLRAYWKGMANRRKPKREA